MNYLIVYMEILALAFVYTSILFFSVRRDMGGDWEVNIFKVFLLAMMIALVIDSLTHAQYRGFLHMPPLLVATLYAMYMFLFSGALSYLWFLFAELRMGFNPFKKRWVFWISIMPALIISCMCFASIFTGWFFSVDENGIYSRGPLWALQNIITYMYFLFTTVHAVVTARKEPSPAQRKRYYILAMFVIAPFLGALLQLFIGDHPFVAPATSIAMLFIFINIQSNMVNQDSLTGLNNRRSVERYIEGIKSGVTERNSFYLYVMDADDFKKINDSMGHIEGDRVLRILASLIRKAADEYRGFAGRIGGDEFVAVIKTERINDPEDFEKSFIEAAKREEQFLELPYRLSMSFGYVKCESADCETDALIDEADKIMYDNKARKKQASKVAADTN